MNKALRFFLGLAAFLTGSAVAMGCSIIAAPRVCVEDDPCWDCATMGKDICGPVEVEVVERGDGTRYCLVSNQGQPLVADAYC